MACQWPFNARQWQRLSWVRWQPYELWPSPTAVGLSLDRRVGSVIVFANPSKDLNSPFFQLRTRHVVQIVGHCGKCSFVYTQISH